jgi:hypothetical protein
MTSLITARLCGDTEGTDVVQSHCATIDVVQVAGTFCCSGCRGSCYTGSWTQPKGRCLYKPGVGLVVQHLQQSCLHVSECQTPLQQQLSCVPTQGWNEMQCSVSQVTLGHNMSCWWVA